MDSEIKAFRTHFWFIASISLFCTISNGDPGGMGETGVPPLAPPWLMLCSPPRANACDACRFASKILPKP